MSGSSLYDIQKAIYDTLLADVDLNNIVDSRIYDFTPDNTVFPYITIGEDTVGPYSTFDRFGQESIETIHVWSRYNGYAEVKTILDQIARLLGNKFIPIDNWYDVGCWYDSTTNLVEPDGITRHAVTRYKFKVLQKPDP